MSSFSLTDETAIDVLIFWVQSSDGSISYEEKNAVKKILDNMQYDMSTYQKTLSYINSLSMENIQKLEEEALDYVKRNFSDDGKKHTYSLLETIANCEGKITKQEEEKLEILKELLPHS